LSDETGLKHTPDKAQELGTAVGTAGIRGCSLFNLAAHISKAASSSLRLHENMPLSAFDYFAKTYQEFK